MRTSCLGYLLLLVTIIFPATSGAVEIDSMCVSPDHLQAQELKITPDSLCRSQKFNSRELILPGALMVAGVIGSFDSDNNFNRDVRDAMQELSNGHRCNVDNYLRFVPSTAHLFLGSLGVKSKHNFKERFLISATSHAAMAVMGYGLKYSVKEQRPNLADRHSFPSGHVALAFTGAELMRSEYGTTCGIGGYAIATGVAFLRLYNNKHWLNDVLMGAGIGILSARIGTWMLPLERKWLKMNGSNNTSSTIALTPYYNPDEKSVAIMCNILF